MGKSDRRIVNRQPMQPELELLLHLSRTELGGDRRAAVEAVDRHRIDWAKVLQLSNWYQVGGFVGLHLNDADPAIEAPADIRKATQRLADENRVRYVYFVEPELVRILERLNRDQIATIALKGSALNRRIYRQLGLRPIGDLDLLLEEADLPRAKSAIDELGYSQRQLAQEKTDHLDDYHYCPRLLSPDGSIEIELHRHLVRRRSPLYFDIAEVWRQAREIEIGGATALVLGPCDQVSHLCLKFFLDRTLHYPSYAALRQLVDVAETVSFHSDEMDWERWIELVDARGHAGVAFCALHTARELLRLSLDDWVLDRLRPAGVDEQQLTLFVDCKVIDLDPWFFHELVEPDENRGIDIAKSAVRRLLPEARFLRGKYWDRSDRSSVGQLYSRHLSELGRSLFKKERSSRRIRDHLTVDRWMHRLVTDSTR